MTKNSRLQEALKWWKKKGYDKIGEKVFSEKKVNINSKESNVLRQLYYLAHTPPSKLPPNRRKEAEYARVLWRKMKELSNYPGRKETLKRKTVLMMKELGIPFMPEALKEKKGRWTPEKGREVQQKGLAFEVLVRDSMLNMREESIKRGIILSSSRTSHPKDWHEMEKRILKAAEKRGITSIIERGKYKHIEVDLSAKVGKVLIIAEVKTLPEKKKSTWIEYFYEKADAIHAFIIRNAHELGKVGQPAWAECEWVLPSLVVNRSLNPSEKVSKGITNMLTLSELKQVMQKIKKEEYVKENDHAVVEINGKKIILYKMPRKGTLEYYQKD